jgi:N-methylhydantoinase B
LPCDGFGNPRERAPEAVLADVRRGFVSVGRAREDYGVVLKASGREIDVARTARLRPTTLPSISRSSSPE